MAAHSVFPPSSAKRYLNCPPALKLEQQFPDEESVYAAEGSAGHALAEHLIKKHLKLRSKRPVSDYFTDELVEAVEDYVSYVTGQIEEAKKTCRNPVFEVERRTDLSLHVKGCFGTADMVIITDRKVHIIDLKLGKGVMVDAEWNTQLMLYGLGILDMAELLYDTETVELTIVQPRLEHFSTWEISVEELHRWAAEVLEPKARMALAGEGEYRAGDHCRFCKARHTCRARAEEYLQLARMEFAPPALLSDGEVAEVLLKADELKRWAEEIYAYAQNEAVVNRKEWPGFKLVAGRSNRKYTSEEDAAQAAQEAGYTDIYKHSLIGITEMEKLMGKKKFREILGAYVYKPEGKVILVPESDKREAVPISTAEADFKEE